MLLLRCEAAVGGRQRGGQGHGAWQGTLTWGVVGVAGISSGPPQVSDQAKLLQYTRAAGSGLAMFCQAQGFPVPSFR